MAGFQVKVVLEGVQPPLWRRILLPDQLSFADLHVILQIVFGWQEEHLHDFSFQRSRVRISDTEYADADLDEKDVCADSYLKAGWIRYTYDFGDDWRHKIVLEKNWRIMRNVTRQWLNINAAIWKKTAAVHGTERKAVRFMTRKE